MDLTPIRVRGKRRPKASGHATDSSTSSRVSSRASTPATSTASTSRKRDRVQSTALGRPAKARKKTTTLSRLEQLPTELLQAIFLESINLDLPAASPHLARVLSSRHLFIELSFRALYKPLSHFRDKWSWHGSRVIERLHRRQCADQPPDASPVPEETALWNTERELRYPAEKEAMYKKLAIPRWKECRVAEVQARLLNSRFFTWQFLMHLIRKAHPVFQQEVRNVHRSLGLEGVDMMRKEQFWISTPSEELIVGMLDIPLKDASIPSFQRYHRLPWLRIKDGVPLPSKVIFGPWTDNRDQLFRWLVQSGAGTPSSGLGNDMQRIPPEALHQAVTYGEEWIVYFYAIRCQTPVSTDHVRAALQLQPFNFIIVQNLLCTQYEDYHTPDIGKIDTLDPFIWKWIEDQEEKEKRIESTGMNPPIEDCISRAKWLRKQLDWISQPDCNVTDPYFPMRGFFENFLIELSRRAHDGSLDTANIHNLARGRMGVLRDLLLVRHLPQDFLDDFLVEPFTSNGSRIRAARRLQEQGE